MSKAKTYPPLKGRALQSAIIGLAHHHKWRVAHTPPVQTERGWRTPVAADGKGWPDLVMLRERIVVAEVKGDGDRLTEEQSAWIEAFLTVGVEAYIWTPKSWRSGEIERILRNGKP